MPAAGSLTVYKLSVTVTASSPSAITAGDNYPTITFTTNPSPITWISQPTCAVYASSDTTYSSPKTGASTAGTYVTHCTGGTSARYTPTQANGSLTVNAAASVGTKLPSVTGLRYAGMAPCTSDQYSSAYNILFVSTVGAGSYYWVAPQFVTFPIANWPPTPTGARSFSYPGGTDTIYYSPDGVNYIPFP